MKGNNFLQKLIDLFIDQEILVGLSALLFVLLVAPLWKTDFLEIYDAPGHVSLVWYLKTFLWPGLSGWNPFFLAGFPQGIFYPSLFHWLSATLSFLFSIDTSIKLLISLAILATPFAAYFAVKSTIQNTNYRLPTTILVLIFLAVLPNFLGAGFRGLFQIGLLPDFFSTPIFLLFISVLHGEFKKGKFLAASLIFAVLILTHLVAVVAGALYLLVYSAVLFKGGKLKGRNLAALVGVSALLTSFFWVPFVLYLHLTSVSVHLSSYFLTNVILGFIVLGLCLFSWKRRSTEIFALSAFSFVLLTLAVLDSLLIRNFSGSALFNLLYPLHIYRFQPYAYLALILSLAEVLSTVKMKILEKVDFKWINLVLFLLLAAYLILKNPVIADVGSTLVGQSKLGGRFIEGFRRTDAAPLLYSAQTNLVMQDPQSNPWAYGLFTDSTPNGSYLGSLIRSLHPNKYPEGEGTFTETKFVSEKNIQTAIALFGIKYVLNLDKLAIGADVGKWQAQGESKNYTVEQVGSGSLVEVSRLNPIPVGGNFEKKVESWWAQKDAWASLPFEPGSGVQVANFDPKDFNPKTKVAIVDHNKDWSRIKLKIDSKHPQPVLVKISYFPWWKATSAGKNVPIYRAAPNLMLVFADGQVDLEFKEPVWLKVLYLVSIASFLIVISHLLQKRWRHAGPG